jgi:hypothetical protein
VSGSVATQAGQSVTLAWHPNATPDTMGYAVYSGSQSGNYSSRLDVGTNTTATISGLKEGQTNYFVVTAYNSARVESIPSSEVAYLVPGMLRLIGTSQSGATLKFPVAPGHWYDVQASTDLKSWASIGQTAVAATNSWVNFQDTNSGSFPRRYYRLVMH